jgi:hypothetical protein
MNIQGGKMASNVKAAFEEIKDEIGKEVEKARVEVKASKKAREKIKAKEEAKAHPKSGGGGGNPIYGIGLIGAWIYFIGGADNWTDRAIGFFKGLVWPAFLVHALFKDLEKE